MGGSAPLRVRYAQTRQTEWRIISDRIFQKPTLWNS